MEGLSDRLLQIAEKLKILGLSVYEAQGFASLVYHGVANADVVADTANIPRTSAYKVMESLVEKGLAKYTEGRPRMFKPDDLTKIRSSLEAKLDELFLELRKLQEMLPSRGEPQLVYTIEGKESVMNKLSEMFNLSEQEIYVSTPLAREIRTELAKVIDNAVKRGVDVVFVIPAGRKAPPGVRIFRREGLIATDVVSDKTRAMLASPELEACGYTDNPALAIHVYQFIHMIMEGLVEQKE